ncbi:hypothetical protein BMS77_07700 [Leuconostoc pseudomesenteroides]|nr:hypothetical protein BMS77_07700 [Leuconostoc pseudomesenteroides]OQJ75617.1 hypothetical protein BMS83_07885 [Leuconostoc pseudomesenteroides]ORI36424.1 hypothetical protein BMR88_07265 [Leuconostoc pseudomesenteroides]ORI45295.1 hypothetical protein BMR94_06855 [Leuconostoc pseudomesenteroides]ORI63379.1 hypothetical protein BMS71_07345 [Leuconostoc pseudomesenteroides]
MAQQLATSLCFFVETVWRLRLTDSLSCDCENGTEQTEQFGAIRTEVSLLNPPINFTGVVSTTPVKLMIRGTGGRTMTKKIVMAFFIEILTEQ